MPDVNPQNKVTVLSAAPDRNSFESTCEPWEKGCKKHVTARLCACNMIPAREVRGTWSAPAGSADGAVGAAPCNTHTHVAECVPHGTQASPHGIFVDRQHRGINTTAGTSSSRGSTTYIVFRNGRETLLKVYLIRCLSLCYVYI